MTGEELARCGNQGPCELVKGRVVSRDCATVEQGILVAELGTRVGIYWEEAGRGRAGMGRVGIYTEHDPDTVRSVDVLVISHERYARQGSTFFFDVAPELVIEVLAGDDLAEEVAQKNQELFAIGVDRVWTVDPRRRQVRVYRSPEQVETLGMGDVLRDEEILPGFALPLSELFRD